MNPKFRTFDRRIHRMSYEFHIVSNGFYLPVEPSILEHLGKDDKFFKFDTDEAVIMQFSSRKDKNGKEIYVDDILKSEGRFLIVKFGKLPLDKSGDCVCTYPAFYCRDIKHDRYYECCEIGDWMEVVGNIHENGSLLVDDANVAKGEQDE